jgi:hypothetical protein
MRFVYYTLAHHWRMSPTASVLVSSYWKKIFETTVFYSSCLFSFHLSLLVFMVEFVKSPLLAMWFLFLWWALVLIPSFKRCDLVFFSRSIIWGIFLEYFYSPCCFFSGGGSWVGLSVYSLLYYFFESFAISFLTCAFSCAADIWPLSLIKEVEFFPPH